MNDEEKKKTAIDLLKMYTEQQARAFGALRQASFNCDSDATSRISACYYLGIGCMQNYKAAANYAKKVVSSNTNTSKALAQFIYGSCLSLGKCVLQSHEEAVKYFSLAAKSGLRLAKYRLASYYASGQGGVQNMKRARELFLEAAYAGDPASMGVVGQMCLEGIGGARDKGIGGARDGDQAVFGFNERRMLEIQWACKILLCVAKRGSAFRKICKKRFQCTKAPLNMDTYRPCVSCHRFT